MVMKMKNDNRTRRHKRVRAKIYGTADRPRLSVFRSNKHVWVQLIDDAKGVTLAAFSDREEKGKKKKGGLRTHAKETGELIARKAIEKNITQAVFDRGGYQYHGVVKAVAEGARKGGLKM